MYNLKFVLPLLQNSKVHQNYSYKTKMQQQK